MNAWTQVYDPFDMPWLSTLIAALPVILLLGLLATGKATAHFAISGIASKNNLDCHAPTKG